MKTTLFKFGLALTLAIFFASCSSDDDANSNTNSDCESCTISGEKAEICNNGDGTYTATFAGETDTISQSDLDALELTAKEYIDLVCALGITL